MAKSEILSGFERSTGPTLPSEPTKSTRVFYSAVVIDFISNPAEYMTKEIDDWPESGLPAVVTTSLSSTEVSELEEGTVETALTTNSASSISNSALIKKLPRNCIIAQVVSDGGSKRSNPEIFYPFFSPHLCMPVNAGEQVWIIYESSGSKTSMGYWICRKPTDLQVDDLNYTHNDRTTLNLSISGEDQSAKTTFEGESLEAVNPFSFPLGGNGNTANNTLTGASPYNDIIERAMSYQNQFVGETVPRFSKRAADLVLQGSNNTLISLGQDRGWASTYEDGQVLGGVSVLEPTVGGSAITGAGTIDIVAGRGQEDSEIQPPDGESDTTAVSEVGEAIRGLLEDITYDETDKAPQVSGTDSNVNEGDPDFINDLSRVYVSMLTNADQNFEIEIAGMDASEEGPAIVLKSSQVRLLARDDLKIHVGEVDTGASVVIKSDGNIVFIPGEEGVIKLGGDDADLAILTSGLPATNTSGEITHDFIVDSTGGTIARAGGRTGSWATKVLIK